MEDGTVSSASEYDLSNLREEDFELHTTYIVPDLPVEQGTPNRAESTLPRNLVLKASQALSDVSTSCQLFLVRVTEVDNTYKYLYSWITGSRCMEHGIHSQRNQIRTSSGRSLCQRCSAQYGQQKVFLEGKCRLQSPIVLSAFSLNLSQNVALYIYKLV